jgi:hypothetical protein
MHFAELEHLKILPGRFLTILHEFYKITTSYNFVDAYFASLREISRRISYGKIFSNRIQRMAEDLAHMREKEVYRNICSFLPFD